MNRTIPLLKILAFGVSAIALSLLFFPFVIPGLLLSRIVKNHHERWVLPLVALMIVMVWRVTSGNWFLSIAGESPTERIVEIGQLVLNWAYGVIFLRAGFRMPSLFKDGLRTAQMPRSFSKAAQ